MKRNLISAQIIPSILLTASFGFIAWVAILARNPEHIVYLWITLGLATGLTIVLNIFIWKK